MAKMSGRPITPIPCDEGRSFLLFRKDHTLDLLWNPKKDEGNAQVSNFPGFGFFCCSDVLVSIKLSDSLSGSDPSGAAIPYRDFVALDNDRNLSDPL